MTKILKELLIPAEWLVPARVTKVVGHWTAGPGISRPDEAAHYHVILNQDLTLNRGWWTAKDNETTDDYPKYAAHTGHANKYAFGYALAGMRLAKEKPFNSGPSPITEEQWSRGMIQIAQICKVYGVPVTPKTVLTHAEVQGTLGIQQKGKWDISILPWQADKWNTAKLVGDLMRAEVKKILESGRLP